MCRETTQRRECNRKRKKRKRGQGSGADYFHRTVTMPSIHVYFFSRGNFNNTANCFGGVSQCVIKNSFNLRTLYRSSIVLYVFVIETRHDTTFSIHDRVSLIEGDWLVNVSRVCERRFVCTQGTGEVCWVKREKKCCRV